MPSPADFFLLCVYLLISSAVVAVCILIIGGTIIGVRKNQGVAPTGKFTIRNNGESSMQILEVRNVTTGKEKRLDFTLEPGASKTFDLN